jgi:uncharacterized protein (DUF433 family)
VSDVTQIDPDILSGTPTFRGTLVPMKNLFDYLEAGNSVDDFLDDFPSVDKDQLLKLFQEYKDESTKKPKVE